MASGTSPQFTWTDETLQPLRSIGDPLADAVITELHADGGVDAMNALMRNFVANEHPVPANLPAPIRHYLEQSSQLPDWADPAMINAGEDVFWRARQARSTGFHSASPVII